MAGRRLHVAEGVFDAGEQHVEAPGLVGIEVVAVGLEDVAAVEGLGAGLGVGLGGEALGLGPIVDAPGAGDPGIALLQAADGLTDSQRRDQPAPR